MNLWVYAPKQGAETASFGDRLAVPLMRFTLFKESRKSLSKGHSKRHSRRHSTRPGGRRASFEHFLLGFAESTFSAIFCRAESAVAKTEVDDHGSAFDDTRCPDSLRAEATALATALSARQKIAEKVLSAQPSRKMLI